MTTPFERYMAPSPHLDPATEKQVDHTEYQLKAKTLVADNFNRTFFPDEKSNVKTTEKDFYVVWFVKVLGNWKALVSTDVISGQYWEVTYDGAKEQTYVDHYVKRHNQAYSDASYEGLVAYNAKLS